MPANNRGKYGREHKARRKRWLPSVRAGLVACWRCGDLIPAGAKWDLGHLPGGGAHPEHVRCNRSDGGKQRAAQLYGRPAAASSGRRRFWSRHWFGSEYDPRCRRCYELGHVCEVAAEWARREREAA